MSSLQQRVSQIEYIEKIDDSPTNIFDEIYTKLGDMVKMKMMFRKAIESHLKPIYKARSTVELKTIINFISPLEVQTDELML
jgi:hypothetical protein